MPMQIEVQDFIDSLALRKRMTPSGEPVTPFAHAHRASAAIGMRVTFTDAELQRVSPSGGLLLLASRPYGAVEGTVLLPALLLRRPDLKVLQDPLLEADPVSRQSTLAGGTEQDRFARAHALLSQGGAVLAFVGPRLARGKIGGQKLPEESVLLARLARSAGAAVQTLNLSAGKRRFWLQALGLDKPQKRRTRLMSKLGWAVPRLTVTVGGCLSASRLRHASSDQEAGELLTMQFWLLAQRGRARHPHAKSGQGLYSDRPLASALPPLLLEAELDLLPPAACLARAGNLECWVVSPGQAPNLLREIGRLREVVFRAVGEGTGRPLDLDRFDGHYLQLFLWDRQARAVAGGYRFVPVERVLAEQGIDGLYVHSLFRFKRQLLWELDPALELGRSFISPAWQKSYGPLLLLWKGLGAWIAAHPRYRRLYGTVSMSASYQPLSRELVASFIKQHRYRNDLARLTRPRQPYAPAYVAGRLDALTWRHGVDMDELSHWVSELEPDGKGLPVLFRQYANLGGYFFGFNTDPAFGDALDGLVCVDLLQAEPRMLARTMGAAESRDYLAWHGRTIAV